MEEPMAQVPPPVFVEGAARNDFPPTYDERSIKEKQSLGEEGGAVVSAEAYYDPRNPDDVYPTEEEAATLRRIPDRVPLASYLVAVVELGERFSYYGTTVVFTNFIQRPLPPGSRTGSAGTDGQPGALGLGQKAAFGLTTFNTFWIYLTPLLGAYIADQHLGRYSTIQMANFIVLFGHILLVICAIPGVIDKNGIIGLFCVAIIVMGLGSGMFKSNVSPLIAEQVTRQKAVVEVRNGTKVLVDPALTTARLFMYFYLFINIGSLVGQIGMVYAEKYVGFWLSYLLPTIVFLICPIILLLGKKRYVLIPPSGSVYPLAFKVIKAVNKGTWSLNPKKLFGPRNWDNAKPSQVVGARPSWMRFDDAWVDEVKRAISACKVFLFYPVYWIAYNQMTGNLTSQAATMQLNGVPNDIINNINPISLIIFIPIFDLVVYPFLRKHNIRFTPIRRITAGFFCATLAMIWATITQLYIYRMSPCGYSANTCVDADGYTLAAPINVWSQIGSYALIGFSEIFASITLLEYAYSKAPRNMRSIVQAISLLTNAIAAAIGEALVPLSDDPNLVWNYMTCTILAAVGGIGFFLCFRDLDRQEESLNELPVGSAWPKTSAEGTAKASIFSRFKRSNQTKQIGKSEGQ
jgi:POT family proton-dependent oligopeptide transporter